ncbi:hypothetical protein LK996_12680 [Lysobacter sp. A6]|uniref:SnoaL-like domain-containing protein n=1 Tax=Noviluteimonas lactosilytica TaxID=2888523 RepID=A0ABS8JK06_9GAMM|nr:hypothetical protein [Lysobacter lactosilyticus]MCC8363927.1 hypothetical protein [Lysobacter lactosilyticus]
MRLPVVSLRRCFACLAVAVALAGVLAIGGCGGDDADRVARRADGTAMDPLPTPEGARGSVTGMPDKPGPGQQLASNASVDDAIAIDDIVLDDADGDGTPDADTSDTASADNEPTSADAATAIQRYYDAIQSQDFATAYALWSDGGRASGQTPEQFAAGFADTASVLVTVDVPARVEGAVGSRFVEVPVAVESRSRDGRVRRFVGQYTMRRSVVDGATPDQREWRIASADLRELTQ